MKKLLLVLVLPLFLNAQESKTNDDKVQWLTDYDTAIGRSKKKDKNILVYFTGSDWCAPCKKLKQDLFDTDRFKALSQNYVLLYIDFPIKKDIISPEQLAHNKDLIALLNKKGVFPLLKILSANEKVLADLSGYSMDGKIKPYLDLLETYKN